MIVMKLMGRHTSIVNGTKDEVIAIMNGDKDWCTEFILSLVKDAISAGWFRVHILQG